MNPTTESTEADAVRLSALLDGQQVEVLVGAWKGDRGPILRQFESKFHEMVYIVGLDIQVAFHRNELNALPEPLSLLKGVTGMSKAEIFMVATCILLWGLCVSQAWINNEWRKLVKFLLAQTFQEGQSAPGHGLPALRANHAPSAQEARSPAVVFDSIGELESFIGRYYDNRHEYDVGEFYQGPWKSTKT